MPDSTVPSPVVDKNALFKQTALSRGIPEADINKTLFIRRAMAELNMSAEEAKAYLESKQSQQSAQPTIVTPQAVEDIPSTGQEMGEFTPEAKLVTATAQRSLTPQSWSDRTSARREVAQSVERLQEESDFQYMQRVQSKIEEVEQVGNSAREFANLQNETVEDVIVKLAQTRKVSQPFLEISSTFSAEALQEYEKVQGELASQVVDLAGQRNIPLEYVDGEYYTYDKENQRVRVTPRALKELYNTKWELAGAMAGATAGLRIPGPWWAKAIGSIAGAAAGSVAGTEADYLMAAISTQEELDGRVAFEKGVGAATASLTYDTLFGTGYLAAKGTIKLTGAAWRGLARGYDLFVTGNRSGAFQALMTETGLSRTQIEEVVHSWETLHQTDAPGKTLEEQALAIVPTTRHGGENIIGSVRRINPQAASNIASDVNRRSTELLAEAGQVAGDNSAYRVLETIRTVETDVRNNYTTVKGMFTSGDMPIEQPLQYSNQVRDITEKLTLSMSLADSDKYRLMVDKMNLLIDYADDIKTPDDLLEFRKHFTDLKYNSKVRNSNVLEDIDAIIHQVDADIAKVATQNMGEKGAQTWLKLWGDAQEQYSKNLQLRSNVLWRALTRKGVTPKTVANAIVRYGPSIDDAYHMVGGKPVNTYRQIIDSLPHEAIPQVEGMILNDMIERFTIGKLGETRATQYPELARQLRMYEFQSPEALRMQEVITEFAKVHQIDTALLMGTGNISVDQFRSYLTTDPVVRAQFALSSKFFNYISQLGPGPEPRSRALVTLVAEFLDNPLNVRTAKDLMDSVKNDQAFAESVFNLQREIAKAKIAGTENAQGRAKLWKDASGKLFTQQAPGRTQADSIPLQRIVREDFVKDRYGMETFKLSELPRARKLDLINMGYEAIALADGQVVRLF